MRRDDPSPPVDRPALLENAVASDPVEQFRRWYAEAHAAGGPEPDAMTLATVGADGRPSARVVLLRGFDADGFAFFTNFESRKGSELAGNPRAALVFHWPLLDRQVRIEGAVERLTDAQSDAYFGRRPLGSRIAAWASPQSRVIESREALEREVERRTREFRHHAIPRPPFWGGFRVRPETVEFWQSRLHRLHDRLRYRATGDRWTIERLAP
jgi:pyridoxamine 5'-phosphate oxidase